MNKPRPKLLFRIFLTYLITTGIIIGVFAGLQHSFRPPKVIPKSLEKNIILYLESLEAKFLDTPSKETLKSIQDEYGVGYRSPHTKNWSDELGIPPERALHEDNDFTGESLRLGRNRGNFYAAVGEAPNLRIWFFPLDSLPRGFRFPFALIAGAIAIILSFSFLTIRWMMAPLNVLLKGTSEISKGNLKYRIPEHRKNEFGQIASGFNKMAEQIENMLKQKESLLMNVSHELRSPLTRIQVAASLITDNKLSEQIKSDVSSMDQMLSQVLNAYRLREGKIAIEKSRIELLSFLEQIATDYESSKIKINLDVPPTLTLFADAHQIAQVIRNLIENSIKYNTRPLTEIAIQAHPQADQVEFCMTDNGPGIDPSHLNHVFDPFYQANQARTPGASGFGLGLSICKSIIEAHQGWIKIENRESSTPGIVITFSI